jgi:cyclic pyranopterin phosphate synthase
VKKLTHTDSRGKAKMVDVSLKARTKRTASASAQVQASKEVLIAIKNNEVKKGDVFTAAKLAGIQAAKRTYELIPLCHNISLTNIDIEFKTDMKNQCINISSSVSANDVTGVEMEDRKSVV